MIITTDFYDTYLEYLKLINQDVSKLYSSNWIKNVMRKKKNSPNLCAIIVAKSFTDIEDCLNMKLDGSTISSGDGNTFVEDLQKYIAILIVPFKFNAKCVASAVETMVKRLYTDTVESQSSMMTVESLQQQYPEIINFFKFAPQGLQKKLTTIYNANARK